MSLVQVSPISTAFDSSATLRSFCRTSWTSGNFALYLCSVFGSPYLVGARKNRDCRGGRDLRTACRRHRAGSRRRRACTTSASHRTWLSRPRDCASSGRAARRRSSGSSTGWSSGSNFHAEPPKSEIQLLGGWLPGLCRRARYTSRDARFVFDDFESINHGCWSEVWLMTKSRMMRTPCFLPSATM